MDWMENAIDMLGQTVLINKAGGTSEGVAVIYPARIRTKTDGGVSFLKTGMSEPQLYYMLSPSSLSAGIDRGDTVNDEAAEYYVLWKDEIRTSQGSYDRVCMRKMTAEKGMMRNG